MKSMRDFDLLNGNSNYGATLTFIDRGDSLKWEPGAALPDERMLALKEAKKRGIKTWVSLEPSSNLNRRWSLSIGHMNMWTITKWESGIMTSAQMK